MIQELPMIIGQRIGWSFEYTLFWDDKACEMGIPLIIAYQPHFHSADLEEC